MVKNKRKQGIAIKKKVQAQMPKMRNRNMGPASDAQVAAKKYASMLVDPCRAELDYAPYNSAKLDFVTRRKGTGVSGTEAFVVTFWHPAMGAFASAGTTGGFTGALTFGATLSPFVDATVLSAKPVAGCFGVEWVSSESSRQGWISAGIVTGGQIAASLTYRSGFTAFSIDSWARIATHTERMPVDKFEMNWVPGPRDNQPVPYIGGKFAATAANEVFYDEEMEGRNFIMIVMSNIGSANVLSTVTSICEIAQSAGLNTTTNAASVTKPTFDYVAVLDSLQKKDTSWYVNTFKKIAQFTSGAVGAYTGGGLPGILGYLTLGASTTINAATKNYLG